MDKYHFVPLKNKYNPNTPRKVITTKEMSESFDKLYKASKWSKITIFKQDMDYKTYKFKNNYLSIF